jgi:hypothetical protein
MGEVSNVEIKHRKKKRVAIDSGVLKRVSLLSSVKYVTVCGTYLTHTRKEDD